MGEPKYPEYEPMPDRINVHGMKWFDKANGNTYHSAWAVCEYPDGSIVTYAVPFQYGYDQQYVESAYEALISAGVLPEIRHANGRQGFGRTCEDLGIRLQYDEREGTKRQAIAWGEAYA